MCQALVPARTEHQYPLSRHESERKECGRNELLHSKVHVNERTERQLQFVSIATPLIAWHIRILALSSVPSTLPLGIKHLQQLLLTDAFSSTINGHIKQVARTLFHSRYDPNHQLLRIGRHLRKNVPSDAVFCLWSSCNNNVGECDMKVASRLEVSSHKCQGTHPSAWLRASAPIATTHATHLLLIVGVSTKILPSGIDKLSLFQAPEPIL